MEESQSVQGDDAQDDETREVSSDSGMGDSASAQRRRRRQRPFPVLTFEESLVLGDAIQQHAAGDRVRRLTLFDSMSRDAESAASRNLVTSSNQYGITTGSYKAEYLELTEKGKIATSDSVDPREQLKARFALAVEGKSMVSQAISKILRQPTSYCSSYTRLCRARRP